jgi:acyl carrier protein
MEREDMNTEEIDVVKLFQEAAFEVSGRKLEGLTLDTPLAELALDSVIVLEVVSHVEQTLSVRFEDEDLAKLSNMRDLRALIQKARKAA